MAVEEFDGSHKSDEPFALEVGGEGNEESSATSEDDMEVSPMDSMLAMLEDSVIAMA